jgi:hypothetical protein
MEITSFWQAVGLFAAFTLVLVVFAFCIANHMATEVFPLDGYQREATLSPSPVSESYPDRQAHMTALLNRAQNCIDHGRPYSAGLYLEILQDLIHEVSDDV